MLTHMSAAAIVEAAKRASGLSFRDLAERADVAASTITRIQSGAVAPTVSVLERIVDAAGFDLVVELRRRGTRRVPRLADLSDAWAVRRGRVQPEWTRWRALLDHLALHPGAVADAIFVPPPPAGQPIIDALLAGVAEKLADDAAMPRPAWCEDIPALHEPYAPPVPRHAIGRAVPPQLANRGLIIDTESLWRDRATVYDAASTSRATTVS